MSSFAELTFFDYPILHFKEVDSTSDFLKRDAAKHPQLILADFQSNGRGQFGRNWESLASDNLCFSFQFFPENIFMDMGHKISQAVAISLIEVLNDIIYPERAYIKWPNDIIVKDKKIAGILIESTVTNSKIDRIIVGIGLNVNQKRFSNQLLNASSLALIFPNTEWDRLILLRLIIEKLEVYIGSIFHQDYQAIINRYLYKINETISVIYKNQEIQVINLGVNNLGYWLLDHQTEKRILQVKSSQEIKYLYN